MTKLIFSALAVLSLAGCSTLDMERTYLVENDMTPDEVLAVVGIPPTDIITTPWYFSYIWAEDTIFGTSKVFTVDFNEKGRVIGKEPRAKRQSESDAAQARLYEEAQRIAKAYPNAIIRQMPSPDQGSKNAKITKLPLVPYK